MRLIPERSPFPRLLVFPVAVIAVFGVSLSRSRAELLHEAAHCRVRDLTTLPCPTCGGTLAAVSLARGDLMSALKANPVVALVLIGMVLWVVWGLLATLKPGWRRQVELSRGEKRRVRIAAGAAILVAWAYQFIRLG